MPEREKADFMATYLAQTWNELAEYMITHPEKLAKAQLDYWQSYFKLYNEFANHKQPEMPIDKRFQHEGWQNNLIFNFIQRSHQLLSEHVKQLYEGKNEKIAQKLRFFSEQFINSIAPSNFLNTNPELLSKTIETNGANLIEGFKKFQEDIERGNGHLQITLSDVTQFELGKNIAFTPGKVVYQNDIIQLIQYTASTKEVHQHPLLIIPPWINKFYIFDLQTQNSFVKWLIDQGYTVFMISWVNPDAELRDKEFSDYLQEGPLAALKAMAKITQNQPVNILGYCVGGTLLGCLLSYLAQMQTDIKILSATFLTSMFDFSQPGELGTFIDEKQISLLEKYMNKTGYIDGNTMSTVFSALRANDLIWTAFVNNYLKGEPPKPFDLLYWNADSTNIPAPVQRFYLRNMYLNNLLIDPGKIKLAGVPMDLGKIALPCYFLAAHEDHIVPWKSCYQSQQYLKADVKFVLTGSGHVAGVINPPHKKKYGYWTNKAKPADAEQFLATATYHEGSWWTHWRRWLKKYAGNLYEPDYLKSTDKNHIEDAPGSYVKVKVADIFKLENNLS